MKRCSDLRVPLSIFGVLFVSEIMGILARENSRVGYLGRSNLFVSNMRI